LMQDSPLHTLTVPTLPTLPTLPTFRMTTADDYSGYTKDDLVHLCRAKNVSGHSKKKVPELIELLMKAGVVPEKKAGTTAKRGRPVKVDTESVPQDSCDNQSTSSTSSHEYIFHAEWKNVLQYMEDESVQLVLADHDTQGDWIVECIRTLEPNGILVLRGMSDIPACVATATATATWTTVGSEKVLVVCKGAEATAAIAEAAPAPATLTKFYETLITNTRSDATLLLPFASEDLCKLVRKHRRSFVTMECDVNRITRLYDLLH
jgi:hypothetical protein